MTSKNTFIFDMDGVIIDSETSWREAQIEELAKYGVNITVKECIQYTMGQRIDDIARIWSERFDVSVSRDTLKRNILNKVIDTISKEGVAKDGLMELLEFLKHKGYKIGLATSSSFELIDAVLDRLSIRPYFDSVCSADDEAHGKPHPAVYLRVAQKLQAGSGDCIVLEDSVTGMVSAKAAQMMTLVVTESSDDPRFSLADGVFSSMKEVTQHLLQI